MFALLSRDRFFNCVVTSMFCLSSTTTTNKPSMKEGEGNYGSLPCPAKTTEFHAPGLTNNDNNNNFEGPIETFYQSNPTPFGRILEGSLPSRSLSESTDLYAFCDRSPCAPLHGLVIPKEYIRSIHTLQDPHLVKKMEQMAMTILEQYQPNAKEKGDYILCFHVPPFISVGHLRLHVIAPASEMKWFHRYGKYLPGTPWCTDVEKVYQRLKKSSSL